MLGHGFVHGFVHVLEGPDHLSALIVLSAGISWRAAKLGSFWGIGHSLAMILLTVVYLASGEGFNVHGMGDYLEFLIGILMILIGLWGVHHYIELHRRLRNKCVANELVLARAFDRVRDLDVVQEVDEAAIAAGVDLETDQDVSYQRLTIRDTRRVSSNFSVAMATAPCRACIGLTTDITRSGAMMVTAAIYGSIHGFADTGHALEGLSESTLHDAGKVSAFLAAYTGGAILAMTLFAGVYGELSGRVMRASALSLYVGGLFSSLVPLCVGLMWLALVESGQLDNVFS